MFVYENPVRALKIWQILLIVGGLGALGGFANCALSGEFALPHSDAKKKVWRPGWLSNIFVGALAALVVWALYGPLSSYDLATGAGFAAHLPVAQMGSSVLIGISGSRILTTMAQRQAERSAKIDISKAMKDALEKGGV